MTTTSAPTTPKPRRRWLQFSLRTMQVLMLVATLPLGWFEYKIKQAGEQREAVAAIRSMGGFIEYDYSAGTHDCPGSCERLVVNWNVEHFFRDASAGWATNLDSLDFSVSSGSSPDFLGNLTESYSHGNFDQAAPGDFSGECEGFCPAAFFRSQHAEFFGTIPDDPGDGREGFDIVDQCGFFVKSAF